MKLSDFDFDLPGSFIAQDPVVPRDSSRLFVFDSRSGEVFHRSFSDIGEFIAGDVLVLNSSKVLPARVVFYVGASRKEMFFLKCVSRFEMRALVHKSQFFRVGRSGVLLSDGVKVAWFVKRVLADGTRIIVFDRSVYEVLDLFGVMPLPPYIDDSSSVAGQYQTVYSDVKGSVAAPTAGLHFTDSLLDSLGDDFGVDVEKVLLHVGRGTFSPVITECLEEHVMHAEEFDLSADVAGRLNFARSESRDIVAVGTTSVRVLESNFQDGVFVSAAGETDIFIYPGVYEWRCVDKLVTNFHLPKSTLLMLVSSFLEGKGVKEPVRKLLDLYEIAKSEGYRFYSFGDGMLIL